MGFTPERRLVALVGPTGSGKSGTAMRLARSAPVEIVNCDSVQIYRGFDIGSAKAKAAEREQVRHHLLDIVEWHKPYDAERFVRDADAAVIDCRKRGVVPVLVGGTGLYLRAFRFGLVRLPPSDPKIRDALFATEAARPGALYERLTRVDPESAAAIDKNNTVYVARALEIFEATGTKASTLRAEHGFREERVPMRIIALDVDDGALRKRIEHRVEEMLEEGLVEEVRGLLAAGVPRDARPMRAVGYREVCDMLFGDAAPEHLAARIVKATWAYARRQRTWLRKERDVEWLAPEAVDLPP